MGYTLEYNGSSPKIIKIDNSNSAVTSRFRIADDSTSIKWVNYNIKHNPIYYQRLPTGAYALGISKSSTSASVKVTSGGGGVSASGTSFTLGGFRDGTTFYISLSANDEIVGDPAGGLKEVGMEQIKIYTIPKIGLQNGEVNTKLNNTDIGGSNTKPKEYSANINNTSFVVRGVGKCVFTEYEQFTLKVRKLLYAENKNNRYTYSSNYTDMGVSSVANTSYLRTTGTNIESYNTNYGSVGNITLKKKTDFGSYSWGMNNDNVKNYIPESQDGNLCMMRFFITSNTGYDSQNNSVYNYLDFWVVVFYRPRLAIDKTKVRFNRDSNTGESIQGNNSQYIYDRTLRSIYVSWDYDTSLPRSGYTKGYKVELYDFNKKLVQTYYTSNKFYNIPLEDMPRINETYLKIIPYYISSDGEYWFQELQENEYIPFVKLIAKLDKPQITYPVENSNWINNEFRVCFELPEDLDKDYIKDAAGHTSSANYRYENIEIEINKNQIFRITDSMKTSTGSIKAETIFSSLLADLTHRKSIVVYPNLNKSMNTNIIYSIRVRVQKKYGLSDKFNGWSVWSDYRNFRITPINYDVSKGDIILATHLNNAIEDVDRVRKSYGVRWAGRQSDAIAKSTIIYASQYLWEKLFQTTYQTKMQVNDYADFDNSRLNIKFDTADKVLTQGEVRQIIWTKEADKVELPNKENMRVVLPDINEGGDYELPQLANDNHYVTAKKDDNLTIVQNKDSSNGIETVVKPGKNYIRYVEENCDALI